ncbi:MAG: PEGA domain-containing protein [Methanoregula sp.]|nr:PEGA domain-containing protein [Methanoregula sp.]
MKIRMTTTRTLALVILGAILLIAPAAAVSVAIYGDTAGFNPDLHKEKYTVVYSLPGFQGKEFDKAVTEYTNSSVDVIFIGADDSFDAATAAAIEGAVGGGKVLVISYPASGKFAKTKPAEGNTLAPGGPYIEVIAPASVPASAIFAGLSTNYSLTSPVAARLNGTAKTGATVLLAYDSGQPALLFWKASKGYVIEWTLPSPVSYMNSTDADTVTDRVLTHVLDLRAKAGIPTATPTAALTTAPTTPSVTTPGVPPTTAPTKGSISFFSSPAGANVFFDGMYRGITPLNLTDIAAGYHLFKLSMDDRYDYDGSIYVIAGETVNAYGKLPMLPKGVTNVPTPVPTIAATPTPTTTQSPDPLSNPTVVAAAIGTITAGIGAFATIYSQKMKSKKE